MILGVMSDTHGNVRRMHAVADMLRQIFSVEAIIHLGDNYADARQLEMAGHAVWAVPGLWCPEYHSHKVPRARVETVEGCRIAFAHIERDVESVREGAHVLLSGHTHVAGIGLENGVVHINPGHLRRSMDRGQRSSFGLIILSDQGMLCSIHDANGSLRLLRHYEKDTAGLLVPRTGILG